MSDLMDDEHQKAMKTLQAEIIRSDLECMLRRFAEDAIYDTAGRIPENYGPYLEQQVKRLLDGMFHVCPPEAWELIGKPVMDKHAAEQLHNYQMQQLIMESLTKPMTIPQSIKDELERVIQFTEIETPTDE